MVKSRVEFWLKDRHNLYLQLPVNPEKISITSPFGLETVKIASLGEIAKIGERGFKQMSFNSFFPRDYNSSYCEYEDFLLPFKWVEQIEKWRDERRNIRLIITGTPISIPVFISEFTIDPKPAGSPGDVYYSITLAEFRPQVVRELGTNKKAKGEVKGVSTTKSSKVKQRPTTDKKKSKTYTVVRGDSLSLIAKKQYGDMSKWRTIYDANKKTIGKDPNDIKSGQKLVIP